VKACIRERRGWWVLDWRDPITRQRKWRTFPFNQGGLEAAEAAKAALEALTPGAVDPRICVGAYLEYWLQLVSKRRSRGTVLSYSAIRNHISRPMWKTPVAEVTRPLLKRWLSGLMGGRLKITTVGRLAAIMRAMLTEAVDDGLLRHNPALGLRRTLGLAHRVELNIKAMDAEQLATFLAVARVTEPEHFVRFAVMSHAGLRSGEARGLQTEDVDFAPRTVGGRKIAGEIHVQRQVYAWGGVGPPKGGKERRVHLSDELAIILRVHIAARREYDMRTGRRSPWLLYPEFPIEPERRVVTPAASRVRVGMLRALKAAALPEHFTPHSLRHTYAAVMLSRGESLLYVARQLGDTLQVAAETYGKWHPIPPTAGGPNLLSSSEERKKERDR